MTEFNLTKDQTLYLKGIGGCPIHKKYELIRPKKKEITELAELGYIAKADPTKLRSWWRITDAGKKALSMEPLRW